MLSVGMIVTVVLPLSVKGVWSVVGSDVAVPQHV